MAKNKNELFKAELTDLEISVLTTFYDDGIRETDKCKSPIVTEQRERFKARRDEIARYRDGRRWNRGRPKNGQEEEPMPALPMEGNPVAAPVKPF